VGIFTQPARPAGRNKKLVCTDVALWAIENSVPYEEVENINAPQSVAKAASCEGDLLVVISFGQMISREVVDLFPRGAINVHASMLPKYRGAAPINHAIMQGDEKTGISVITVAERMDAGFVLAQEEAAISIEDTAESLSRELAYLSPEVLLETIGRIDDGTAVYTPQDESQVTFANKLKKCDGRIDWSEPAETLCCKIRGLWPWPGGQADYVSGKSTKCCRVTIAQATVVASEDWREGRFGMLNEDLDVICGRGAIRITKIKPAGGRLMDFADFANGRGTQPGDLFLSIENA
jgi:methionyl-tRNA formyltransferase